MRASLIPAVALLAFSGSSVAAQQSDTPAAPLPAAAADVESLDAIITALYDVISGPAGPRDWDRFRSLFKPGARLIPTGLNNEGVAQLRVWTPDEFASQAEQWFSSSPFYEIEIGRTTESFGQLVHAFSAYASLRAPGEEPFVRGINSIQLLNDGSRWWILSIMWADERSAGEIPERYLASDHH